jgi:hypothetical protein
MSDTTFDVYCPECNICVAAEVIAEGSGQFRSDATNPIDEVDSLYQGIVYFVCRCKRCDQPFLIRQSVCGVPGEFHSVADEVLLYPSDKRIALDGAPAIVKYSHEQAVRALSASLFEPCVLMCRKSIEAVCKHFDVKGRDLNARLQALFEMGQIDARLLNWAHEIRLIGNEAAHDADKKINKRDARDVLDLTEAILIYVFSLSARFEKFRGRRRGASQN